MDPATPKICVFCNQDCSRRPRSKDSRGRYMCNDCLARRRLKTDAAAAGAAGDSERTMVGGESPELAIAEPVAAARPAKPRAEELAASRPEPATVRESEPPAPIKISSPIAATAPAPSSPPASPSSPAPAVRHRAVVWTERNKPRPRDLFEALARRSIDAVEVDNAFMAIAEICRLFRGRAAADGTTDKHEGLLALVTVSPEAQSETCAVFDAVERYASGTPCWMFGPARAPRLRPIVEGDLAEWRASAEQGDGAGVRPLTIVRPSARDDEAREGTAPPPPAKPGKGRAPAQTHAPQLRLTGTDARDAAPKPSEGNADLSDNGADHGEESAARLGAEEPDDAGRAPLLSPEELAMLLGDDEAADR